MQYGQSFDKSQNFSKNVLHHYNYVIKMIPIHERCHYQVQTHTLIHRQYNTDYINMVSL